MENNLHHQQKQSPGDILQKTCYVKFLYIYICKISIYIYIYIYIYVYVIFKKAMDDIMSKYFPERGVFVLRNKLYIHIYINI